MIEAIAKLAFMYLITRTFIELAFPAGRYLIKYIYWSAVILTVFIAVSPIATRLFDDIHDAAATYSKSKEVVSDFLGSDTDSDVGYLGPLERFAGAKWEVPLKGEITQGYLEGQHHGMDIAAKEGKVIIATRPGRVEKVFSDDVYGLAVIISHGGSYESLYAHCSKVLVKERDRILKTDKIALVGNSGKSTGSHLHWEIRKDGKTLDPALFLK